MRLLSLCFLVAALSLSCVEIRSASAGENPPYLVLRAPPSGKHCAPVAEPPQIIPVTPRPYTYGWFGAKSQPQYGRSFGYYRNYTQWRQW